MAVSLMIGTPIVNNFWVLGYYLLILAAVTALAIYDIMKRTVPNKALIIFSTVALAAPLVNSLDPNSSEIFRSITVIPLRTASLGAIVGFTVLLAAAIASDGGNGVGGGDIKLAAVLGFVYGPAPILYILLIASLLAMPIGLIIKSKSGGQMLRLPFVPFIAVGCLTATILKFT